MRLDVVTIFPAYLEPLNVSLVGKARARGQLNEQSAQQRLEIHARATRENRETSLRPQVGEKAARIADAAANTSRSHVGRKGGEITHSATEARSGEVYRASVRAR